MRKFFSQFHPAPIRDRASRRVIGKSGAPIIDPACGEIVAFWLGRSTQILLPTVDIARYASSQITISDIEALAQPDEIIRISEVIAKNTPILGQKVFTTSRVLLGQVLDFELETNGWIVTKLDVGKRLLGVATNRKLINTNHVIRITDREITVSDAAIKNSEKKPAKEPTGKTVSANFQARK